MQILLEVNHRSTFLFNRKKQIIPTRLRIAPQLTNSHLITTNQPNKCNHSNCIPSANHLLNCSNVSQQKIKFSLPDMTESSKPLRKILLTFSKILICIASYDTVNYRLSFNIHCTLLI